MVEGPLTPLATLHSTLVLPPKSADTSQGSRYRLHPVGLYSLPGAGQHSG